MIKKNTTVSKRKKAEPIIVDQKTFKKDNNVKIPLPGVIFFLVLLTSTSFFAGSSWVKNKTGIITTTTKNAPGAVADANTKNIDIKKSGKPELKFFVMSFCPYGNQIEDVLRPVFDALGNKADITPHYILEKITGNLPDYCKTRTGDPTQCETYVKNSNGQLKSVEDCQKLIADETKKCSDESSYLKIGDNLYTSLHGRQEATEDVREICAWNQTENNRKGWWDFVANVNKNCTAQNSDSCWEAQAKAAGLDTNKITDCFNKEAGSLIDKEIALTTQFKVQGSPTTLINDVNFPPETAYAQDGKGSVQIGNKVITQDQFRTPNGMKDALCGSFNKAPKECNTQLAAPVAPAGAGAAPAAGGCGQ